MDTSQKINDWTNWVVDFWRRQDLKLGDGASLNLIEKTEQYLSVKFPDSFKELYKKVDGFKDMDWNEHMFCVWPLERIVEEYDFKRNADCIGFSDFLINSHWIGFVRNQPGIFKWYDHKDYPNPEKIAENFEDAIDLINSSADIIY
jgi:hypothetical protein